MNNLPAEFPQPLADITGSGQWSSLAEGSCGGIHAPTPFVETRARSKSKCNTHGSKVPDEREQRVQANRRLVQSSAAGLQACIYPVQYREEQALQER